MVISFFSALALLSVATIVLAHLHLLATLVLHSRLSHEPARSTANASSAFDATTLPLKTNITTAKKVQKKKNEAIPPAEDTKPLPPPKIKTVYIQPSTYDLERIREELENSDPLTPINTNDDNGNVNERVQATIREIDLIVNQHKEALTAARTELDNFQESHESFIAKFNKQIHQDTTIGEITASNSKLLTEHLLSLRYLMELPSLKDLEKQNIFDSFNLAMGDLHWLFDHDNHSPSAKKNLTLFMNLDGILAKSISGIDKSGSGHEIEACPASFLSLDDSNIAGEFDSSLYLKIAEEKIEDVAALSSVTEQTARESDLYERVTSIKDILSRRDLSSHKPEDDESRPRSIVNDEGEGRMRNLISQTVTAIKAKRQEALTQDGQMNQLLTSEVQTFLSMSDLNDRNDICASSNLIETMVQEGLESLRVKSHMRSALISAVFSTLTADSDSFDPNRMSMISKSLGTADIPIINFDAYEASEPLSITGAPSRINGRKSLTYLLDSPLLRRGIAGWVDSFIDAISGYNDHLDSFLDSLLEDKGSAGSSLVEAFLGFWRKFRLHEEYFSHIKKSGVLGGRTRGLLE